MSTLYGCTIATVFAVFLLPYTLEMWFLLVSLLSARFKWFDRLGGNHPNIVVFITFVPCVFAFSILAILCYDEKCLGLRYFFMNQWCASEIVSNIIKVVVCVAIMLASVVGALVLLFGEEKPEERVSRIVEKKLEKWKRKGRL